MAFGFGDEVSGRVAEGELRCLGLALEGQEGAPKLWKLERRCKTCVSDQCPS